MASLRLHIIRFNLKWRLSVVVEVVLSVPDGAQCVKNGHVLHHPRFMRNTSPIYASTMKTTFVSIFMRCAKIDALVIRQWMEEEMINSKVTAGKLECCSIASQKAYSCYDP